MTKARGILTAALLALMLGSACAKATGPVGSGGSPSGNGIQHPTGTNDLILRIEFVGGFVAPSATVAQIPTWSLLGDGSIITQGPQIEIYPGPALPNLLVTDVTEAAIQKILGAARDAGLLGPPFDFSTNVGIADAPDTKFTVVAEGQRHETSVYGLGIDAASGVITPEEQAARKALVDFQAELTDLGSWLPAGAVGDEHAYAFEGLRVFAMPYSPPEDPQLDQTETPWTLSPALGDFASVSALTDTRCAVVSGTALQELMPALQRANQLTPWTSGGARYSLILRPLLPDESGCPT
jgi:hypothetical protein